MVDILILASTYSTTGVIIWIVIIALAIYAIRAIGRFVFGVVVLIAMIFFSLFMLDNFTNHDLRRYIDIRFYDQTLDDPQAKAGELLEVGRETGIKVVEEVDKVGYTIDEEFGINRKEYSKEWGDSETTNEPDTVISEESVVETDTTQEVVASEKENSLESFKQGSTYTVTYKGIEDLIQDDLNYISEEDKQLIKSMNPAFKADLLGEQIMVSNTETDDGYISVTVK